MSRRVVRELQARIDDLETELQHVTAERARLITLEFWKEDQWKTQPNAS